MKTVSLPKTDLVPSALCLGGVVLGSRLDEQASFALLDAFVDCGGNFVDTAKVYADWLPGERSVSEKTIGRWLRRRGYRSRLVVSTKGAHPELASMHKPRLGRKEIDRDLTQSLRNLQVECIDLYWLHRDDPARPVEPIIDALQEQVAAGKIRYYGCSNWRAARIAAAQRYAQRRGWTGFVANQPLWSLASVAPQALPDPTMVAMDADLLNLHRASNLPAIPYSAQANGFFTRFAAHALDKMNPAQRTLYETPENLRRAARAQQLAAETGLTVTAVVLGYLRSQPFLTIPIVGCHTLAQLADSCRVAATALTAEQLAFLEGASQA
jgi:aryl-alcohol dehydrogenase-like predicted oxidoreductase